MKGAIFDVDGTLLDSMTVWYNITKQFFKDHGLVMTDADAEMYKEMTLEESLPLIRDRFVQDMDIDEVWTEFRRLAGIEYDTTIELKPYAKEYIEKLRGDGVKIAVATSGYERLCKSAFRRLGIDGYIDAYAFSSEVGVNKGNPDIYLLAAERLGVSPTECVVYEDIILGINGAKKAGFETCAVYDDTNAAQTDELKRLSDHYITGWKELL